MIADRLSLRQLGWLPYPPTAWAIWRERVPPAAGRFYFLRFFACAPSFEGLIRWASFLELLRLCMRKDHIVSREVAEAPGGGVRLKMDGSPLASFTFDLHSVASWSWGQIVAPFFGNIPTARAKPAPSTPEPAGNRGSQAVRRGKSGHPRAGFPARNVDAPDRLAARPPAGVASAQAGARRVKPPRRTVPQKRYRHFAISDLGFEIAKG